MTADAGAACRDALLVVRVELTSVIVDKSPSVLGTALMYSGRRRWVAYPSVRLSLCIFVEPGLDSSYTWNCLLARVSSISVTRSVSH